MNLSTSRSLYYLLYESEIIEEQLEQALEDMIELSKFWCQSEQIGFESCLNQ